MKNLLKPIALIFSLLFHIIVVGGLIYWQIESENLSLWSGGRGDGSVSVQYVDLGTMSVESGNPLGQSNQVQEKNKLPKAKLKVKQKLSSRKKKVLKKGKKGTSSKTTSKEKIGSHQSSGIGDSDTPAGGTGSGLDRYGAISKNAPSTLAAIRKKIMRKKRYPLRAKENAWEGQVKVSFKISEAGTLNYVRVSKSSGHKILDDAAVAAVKNATPLPYFSKGISLTLEYKLVR